MVFVAAGRLRLFNLTQGVGAKQARDFHSAEARRLLKSNILQHLCCSNYIQGGPRHSGPQANCSRPACVLGLYRARRRREDVGLHGTGDVEITRRISSDGEGENAAGIQREECRAGRRRLREFAGSHP